MVFSPNHVVLVMLISHGVLPQVSNYTAGRFISKSFVEVSYQVPGAF